IRSGSIPPVARHLEPDPAPDEGQTMGDDDRDTDWDMPAPTLTPALPATSMAMPKASASMTP
ncbi:hypothetical protein BGX23_002848, partial [Mortierella sp. AD031]